MLKIFAFVCLLATVLALPLQKNGRAINAAGCGISKVYGPEDPQPYIVGGTKALKGQYPWMISLTYGNKHQCGGTIIDDKWILTAGHCFIMSENPNLYTVRIGRSNLTEYDPKAVDHPVEKILTHPGWSYAETLQHDIALLKLRRTINFANPSVNIVCLPPSSNYLDTDNKVARITGWGDTKDASVQNLPDTLMQADTVIRENGTCNYWGDNYWHERQLCAMAPTAATCKGDSGGPIYIKDERRAWVQVGITSFGHKTDCLSQEAPNVFTRVSHYVDWIKETVANN